jgi:hypothetical protein
MSKCCNHKKLYGNWTIVTGTLLAAVEALPQQHLQHIWKLVVLLGVRFLLSAACGSFFGLYVIHVWKDRHDRKSV